MGIEVSTRLIHASIAQVLHEISPDAEIFDNPNQQGTPYPAWFIVHRSPVEVRREIRRYYITYYIDVWYLIKQNLTQMFDQYTRIAEQLADKMEYIPVYGYNGVVLHTFETSWSIEMTAMKYSITLRLVCSRDNGVPQPKMEVIEDFYAFLKGLKPIVRLTFRNTSHPELPVQLPEPLFAYEGEPFVLPYAVGIYTDGDGNKWKACRWSIGDFGAMIVLNENATTELEFVEVPLILTGVLHETDETDSVVYERMLAMASTGFAPLSMTGVAPDGGSVALGTIGTVTLLSGNIPDTGIVLAQE